jgi:predicted transposase/invertase (TIGR01784 family)
MGLELKPVYFVGILEFNFDDRENYLTKVELMDADTKERFCDKLTYYYLEMPKFKKQKEELANHLEHWLYVLNNLANLQDIPEEFRDDDCIHKAFDVAEFLRLDKDRQFAYQQDLKTRLDYKNTLDYATEVAKEDGFLDGLEQGIEQGKYQERVDIAKNLLGAEVSVEQISIATGLSEEEIDKLTK